MEKIFYIAQILGALNTIAVVAIILALITLLSMSIWFFGEELYKPREYDQDDARTCKKWIKNSIIVVVIGTIVATFTPSKQTYLFMVGSRALEEIANSEKVQERASKTIDLLDQYLEKKVKESDKE